jgi:ribosomal protein RSM22 (predicted rRNA methylase)
MLFEEPPYEEILQGRIEQWGLPQVRAAAEALSLAYREGKGTSSLRRDPHLLATAYLASRFPATRAVAGRVAREAAQRMELRASSLLDLGAGCGATALGWLEIMPEISQVSALERDAGMAALGRQLFPAAAWRTVDFRLASLGAHDIVVFGYSLGEAGLEPLAKAWAAAGALLVIIEPGTKAGFANVLAARDWLIAQGASIVAPCPSAQACPIEGVDWCHFAERVSRSKVHKLMKGGELGYEDEKYSYLIASKQALGPGVARVIRRPRIEPGLIQLELCTAPARAQKLIRKRDKESFRLARKLKWGDGLPGELA